MNGRERMLSVLLVAVVGGGALIFGVVFWFVKPLTQYNKNIEALHSEIALKQEEIDKFQLDRRKLVLARSKSLPNDAAQASRDYLFYLSRLMADSGLVVEEITPSPVSKLKFQPTIPGIKDVGHRIMAYTVRARGDLKELVSAMETMQATPYEHRIKSLSVDRAEMKRDSKDFDPKLYINMVIETLLVAKSDAKAGLPPGFTAQYVILDSLAAHGGAPGGWGMLGSLVAIKATMPIPESRSYYQIAEKNIFTGKLTKEVVDDSVSPPKKTKRNPVEDEPGPPVGPFMPRYTYLTQTEPLEQTAYYRNRLSRLEKRIDSKPQSGRQQFMVKDDDDEFIYVKGKVLRVDLRTVYFQKEKTIYAWHIGTSLEAALENSLDIDQRDVLDLQIDQEFAKETAADTKEKTPTKKTSTKGSTKGKGKGR